MDDRNATKEELARALEVWHNGVKFGCQKCASTLSIQFDDPSDSLRMVVPYLDKARSERYSTLSNALSFDPDRRFPNLDKVLPLPPATLPPWNGDRDTLVNAARGVSHPQPAPKSPTAYSARKARFHLDAEFLLAPSGETTTGTSAPFAGYWQPAADETWKQQGGAALTTHPALYRPGERFDRVFAQNRDERVEAVPNLTWLHWRTVRHDEGTVAPTIVRGRTREIAPPAAANICSGDARCPVSGTWQPWMRADHPMQTAVNQYWRQAWIVAGQRFPDPLRDWKLDVPASDISWHLMDGIGIDICPT